MWGGCGDLLAKAPVEALRPKFSLATHIPFSPSAFPASDPRVEEYLDTKE